MFGINWKIAYKVFLGWIITLLIVGGTTAILVLQGINSPSNNYNCSLNITHHDHR